MSSQFSSRQFTLTAALTAALALFSCGAPPEGDDTASAEDAVRATTQFQFMVSSAHNGGKGPVESVGNFPYLRTLSAYDSNAHWLDGDRLGYRCVYTFLEYKGELVARVFFNRIGGPDGAYATINDSGMKEGGRYFDGRVANLPDSPGGGPQTEPVSGCDTKFPKVPYEMLPAGDPGPRPVITFADAADGHPLEIRNYDNVRAGSGVVFKTVESSPTLTKVVMYQDRFPVVAGYYQTLSNKITKTSN